MSMSTFIASSRAAPRDPQDVRGKQPAMLFHDKRQYRMAEERSDDELPPQKEGALVSSGKDYRVKRIHRSFQSPATARASARAQVDDIILGTNRDDSGAPDVGDREAERITRLREVNRKRLSALEKKLKQLQQQKQELDSSGDEARDESSPNRQRDSSADQISSPEPPEQPRTAWASAQGRRPTSATQTSRAKLHTRVPAGLPPRRPARDSGDAAPARLPQSEPESDDGRDRGYNSDPGLERVMTGDPLVGGRSSMAMGRRKAARPKSCTVTQPFSFHSRQKKPTKRQRRFEAEMAERREMEEMEYNTRIPARNPPKTSLQRDLYQKGIEKQKQRSEEIRLQCRDRLSAQERPFKFWEDAQRKEAKKREDLEREIEHLKEKMLHSVEKHAVADARIKRVEMEAWRSVQTDFTETEEEELRILKQRLHRDRKLDEADEERYQQLLREWNKKENSPEYVQEKYRRLKEELEKQETRFRSVPVPRHVRDDVSAKLAEEARKRRSRSEDRRNRLMAQASLPKRMQHHEQQREAQQRKELARQRKGREAEEARAGGRGRGRGEERGGDTLTEHHTFRPHIRRGIPDFEHLQSTFRIELAERKRRMKEEASQTRLRPFCLRSEWLPLALFEKHRGAYQEARVPPHLPDKKLLRLGLSRTATQWEVIEKLAASNHREQDKSGLTQEQLCEFYVTPPSQHAISAQISADIQVLKDSRWPHTRGGRAEVKPTPIAHQSNKSSLPQPRPTEASMKRTKHIHEMQKRRQEEKEAKEKAAEEERRKRREMWGIRDRVLSRLAQDAAERQSKKDEVKKQVKQQRREFSEQDKQWEEKVLGKVEALKAKSLLMEDITTRLKKQAKDQFRKHLKAHGLEDLADEIELPR